jgi:hypothetical protein
MRVRDWLMLLLAVPALAVGAVIVVAFVARAVGFESKYGLEGAWTLFYFAGPVMAVAFVLARRTSVSVGAAAIAASSVLSIPATWVALFGVWTTVLCVPGVHDMCLR